MQQTLPFSGSETQIRGQEKGSDVSFESAIEKAPLPIIEREDPDR